MGRIDHLDSYNPAACCGSDCFALDMDDEHRGGPCWGNVIVIDEVDAGDDSYWVHACKGHQKVWDLGQLAYKASGL